MHFFEIISLESQQKCWHQQFQKKEGKAISSQNSLEFAFTDAERQTLFNRSLNYMANGNIKINFGTFLTTKSLQKGF